MFVIKQLAIFVITIVVCMYGIMPIVIWIADMFDIDKITKNYYNYVNDIVNKLNQIFGIKKEK